MYSPRWLFLYPGFALLGLGILGVIVLLPGPRYIGSIGLDIHTFIVACIMVLLGMQSISFALVARRFGTQRGFIPPSSRYAPILEWITLERVLLLALCLLVVGVVGFDDILQVIGDGLHAYLRYVGGGNHERALLDPDIQGLGRSQPRHNLIDRDGH